MSNRSGRVATRRWFASVLATGVLLGGAVLVISALRGELPSWSALHRPRAVPVRHMAQPAALPETDGKSIRATQEGQATSADHPFAEVPRNRSGMSLEGDPFGATSSAEQAWLDRNGYPNERQWAVLVGASDAQLTDAARAGDRVAKTLLDARRLERGDDTAIDAMLEEGARGSTFALELLSSSLAIRRQDLVMAYALSRVVELRGNARVAAGRELMFSRPLTPIERVQGEQEALELLRRIRHLQVTLAGAKSAATDPRPIGGED